MTYETRIGNRGIFRKPSEYGPSSAYKIQDLDHGSDEDPILTPKSQKWEGNVSKYIVSE